MICPSCGNSFRGGQFYSVGGGRSETMRKCPCGHTFKEPPRTPTKSEMIRRAAPDMYEALQEFVAWVEVSQEHGTIKLSTSSQAYIKAKQALAKADGKSAECGEELKSWDDYGPELGGDS